MLVGGELEIYVVVRTNVWTVCGHIMCEETYIQAPALHLPCSNHSTRATRERPCGLEQKYVRSMPLHQLD
jgi:hypothetical protein